MLPMLTFSCLEYNMSDILIFRLLEHHVLAVFTFHMSHILTFR